MNRGIPLLRTCAFSATLGVMLLFSGASLSESAERRKEQQSQQSQQQTAASQQEASQPQKTPETPAQPSGPKPRKIWSNDDVVSLRTPADNYLAEKEAQEAANAVSSAKKAELAKEIREAGLVVDLPPTAEETQGQIKVREEQSKDLQERLDRLNNELTEAEMAKKAAIQQQIGAVTRDLRKIQLEVKVLQIHLEDLPKAAPSDSSAPPPPAPQNPN